MLFHRLWSAFKYLKSIKVIAADYLADSQKQKSYRINSMEEYPLEYKFLYTLKVCSEINVAELAK